MSKRTIQRYLRQARPPRQSGQTWSAFLRNHAGEIWACDFLPVTGLLFCPLYAFLIIALVSRRMVHVGVTRHPTDIWVSQQRREATPFDERLRFLIWDNNGKYWPHIDHLASARGSGCAHARPHPTRQWNLRALPGSVRREALTMCGS